METQPLTLAQGATWDIEDAITGPDGNPMDLTGYSVRAHVMHKPTDAAPVGVFTGSLLHDNVVLLHMSAEDTAKIPAGKNYYDVEIYRMEGEEEIVHKPTTGTITVIAEFTK
ncbi:MAG: hypothetical protein HGA20_14990 [Geobacteraceae bacterium]|nr:hypothetical protein [Geobacteraceae bacterium]